MNKNKEIDMKKKFWKIRSIFVLVVIIILGLTVSCSTPVDSNVSESNKDSEKEEVVNENSSQSVGGNIIISWEEAKEYNGQTVTIIGPVVDYFYSEGWEFTALGIGKADEGGVSVVIYDKDAAEFPKDIESYYTGKIVSVTGEVSYRSISDISQINISSPDKIKVVSESDNSVVEEEVSKVPGLTFSYTNKYPEYWGKIRIVEPLLVDFKDFKVLDEGFIITVSGKIEGSSEISNCFNPEMGIFTAISGLVVDKKGNIKWEQDGYLRGTGSYIKEGEIKEFFLINDMTGIFEIEDKIIIIAYTEGGMIEDSVIDADKGVFGECMAVYNP